MKIQWDESAWNDYLYWKTQDKRTLKRINQLIQDIQRNQFSGIGKPEPLKRYEGYWSRRIDDKNRLVYKIVNENVVIAACKGHYGNK